MLRKGFALADLPEIELHHLRKEPELSLEVRYVHRRADEIEGSLGFADRPSFPVEDDPAGCPDDPDPYPVVLGKGPELLVPHHLEPVEAPQEEEEQGYPDPLENADPRCDPGVLLPLPDATVHSRIRCHRP
jgi:hypothetical protein